ncbi:outer membrane protein [Salinarimonas sp.]|uniref:outer membrane protein n=1 Tax=Salinarimonas sp. TaxID=2766526 RepID=UPI00391D6E92
MKKLLLSTVAVLGMSAAAVAADLPARTMAPAPAPFVAAPVFTWTGFYAGVHAGGAWQDLRARRGAFVPGTLLPDPNNNNNDNGNGNGIAGFGVFAPATLGPRDRGTFMGGGHLGYNQQFGAFVLGGELDLSWMGGRTRSAFDGALTTAAGTLPTTLEVRSGLDWLGTARLRAGVAFDRVLVYATGGVAFGNPDNRVTFSVPGTVWTGRDDTVRAGWTVGGGVEFAWTDNLTVRAEYLYYDLGRQTVTANTTGPLAGTNVSYRFNNSGQIGRVGVSFKF